jgi:glycosyltransferase involved in cell wall biosynthesis
MRILMVSDVYFPRINGVSTSIETFRRSLHAGGHETTLIAPEYPAGRSVDESDVIRIPSRYLPRDPEDRIMKRSALRRLHPELNARSFDIVHIQTPFIAHYEGLRLARALGLAAIETYHTYFEEYLHHYVPLLPRALTRFIARRLTIAQCRAVDALVVPSRAMVTALHDYGVHCPMRIIPTGLEMDRFAGGDGQAFRARLAIPPGTPTLVHVGRIAHEKNIDFLLRMFVGVLQSIPAAVLIIAGEGPALALCKSRATSLGIASNVRFVGYLSRDAALLDCYRAGDLFVFASRTETQGLVLLEAMALGVPVLSTAYMGTVDIVTPQRGACVAPEDEGRFAALAVALLKDPRRRAAMSAEARAFAATWSAPATTRQLIELYTETIERARARVASRESGFGARHVLGNVCDLPDQRN